MAVQFDPTPDREDGTASHSDSLGPDRTNMQAQIVADADRDLDVIAARIADERRRSWQRRPSIRTSIFRPTPRRSPEALR